MDNELWENIINTFNLNKGKIIGGFIGFIIGILVLIIGFFKTLLILLFTIIGYYLGSRWDVDGNLKEFLDKFLPKQYK